MDSKSDRPLLERIGKFVGHDNKVGKTIAGYSKLREANHIALHFSKFLKPIVADNDMLKCQSYVIRHDVYCSELALEETRADSMETDEFDSFSVPCLIQHIGSGNYAGTVRMVRPQSASQQLPIEKYCTNAITDNAYLPSNFARDDICEISRLAVPASFRRRTIDQFDGVERAGINPNTFSRLELRCFPFIAVGLYLTVASLVIREDIQHVYVMVEPRLAKNLRLIGVKFKQIGPVVDYHGQRAAHYISQESFKKGLSPSFSRMRDSIYEKITR